MSALRPRPYLSWSQLISVEQSEKWFKKKYFENLKFSNNGMELGKRMADSLESGEETGNLIDDLTIAMLPKFENMDKEYSTEIDVGGLKIPLFGKIDTAKADLSAFKEFKQGTTAWCQKQADKHGQITFYAVLALGITGKIPKDIELVWAPSEKLDDGTLQLTGEIKRFKTIRTTADILKMKIRMKKAWLRIGELVDEEF